MRGFLGNLNLDKARARVFRVGLRALSGHRADGVAYRVRGQLGPALAPDVGGGARTVYAAQHLGDFLDARGDSAVQLADAEDIVATVASGRAAARYMGRLPEGDGDAGHHAADLILVAYDGRGELVVHAVLAVDDYAAGSEQTLDEVARPFGIVGLHGEEDDVEVVLELPGVGEMHGVDGDGEVALAAGCAQPVRVHRVDVLTPHINQGDVMPFACQERAYVATRGARAEYAYSLCHLPLLVCLTGRPAVSC